MLNGGDAGGKGKCFLVMEVLWTILKVILFILGPILGIALIIIGMQILNSLAKAIGIIPTLLLLLFAIFCIVAIAS